MAVHQMEVMQITIPAKTPEPSLDQLVDELDRGEMSRFLSMVECGELKPMIADRVLTVYYSPVRRFKKFVRGVVRGMKLAR